MPDKNPNGLCHLVHEIINSLLLPVRWVPRQIRLLFSSVRFVDSCSTAPKNQKLKFQKTFLFFFFEILFNQWTLRPRDLDFFPLSVHILCSLGLATVRLGLENPMICCAVIPEENCRALENPFSFTNISVARLQKTKAKEWMESDIGFHFLATVRKHEKSADSTSKIQIDSTEIIPV